jgi:TPR repeat protein
MSSWSWSPKTHKPFFTQKINSSIQIQYLVGPDYDRSEIWCKSHNTFLEQRRQGQQPINSQNDEEEVNIWWLPLELFHPLRLITWKQWILADLWERKGNDMDPKLKSLLAAYIFYGESVLDRLLPLADESESDAEHLRKWFEIDAAAGNHTLVSLESYSCSRGQEGGAEYQLWAEKSADKAALSWGFYHCFNLGRWNKVGEQRKEITFSKVLQWLQAHFEQSVRYARLCITLCFH